MDFSTRRRTVCLAFLLLFMLAGADVQLFHAQENANALPNRVRVVGIIAGPALNSSSPNDEGNTGLSRLVDLLRDLGASVAVIPPDREIPPDIELVILVRPQRALSTTQTAHLWHFLRNGGHLLLAVDPIGHNGGTTESAKTSGINRLLQAEYGLSVVDNLLVEDWFGLESLGDVLSSWSEIPPENLILNAITNPLIQYGLPLRFWGGRSVLVDAVTGSATAEPLFYTESAYGETAPVNFQNGDTAQITLNIGLDTQGRLLLGALATHSETGSRVAVLGDSEILQNVFGQRRVAGRESVPLYVADYIFAHRLLAWLMAVPETEYPGLPENFTWLTLDGDASDWPADVTPQIGQQSTESDYALEQIRAFQNDQFVYLLLETRNPLPQDAIVYIFVDDNAGNRALISVDTQGPIRFRDTLLPDAEVARGDALEIRLPRRVFPTDVSEMARVCVANMSGSFVYCLDDIVRPLTIDVFDPLPVRFGAGPQAYVPLQNVNLRAEPTTRSSVVTILPARTQFAARGRNAAGDWVFVQNGRYEGWINLSLLEMNADIGILPNLEEVSVETDESP